MGEEQIYEQWHEETAAEYFDRVSDYDGTERKDDVPTLDGGIIGGILDTADLDRHRLECQQYDEMVTAIEGELSDQIEWTYSPTERMFAQLEKLAINWAKDNGIFKYVANEAIANCIEDIKRRKESLTSKAPPTPIKIVKYTEHYGDYYGTLSSYDVF